VKLYRMHYTRQAAERSLSFTSTGLVSAIEFAARLAGSWGLKGWTIEKVNFRRIK